MREGRHWLTCLNFMEGHATCSTVWFLSTPKALIATPDQYDWLLRYMQRLNYDVTIVQDFEKAKKILECEQENNNG